MMIRILPLLVLLLCLAPAAEASSNINQTPNDAPQFTKVIDDLPLMPGLRLAEDRDMLFIAHADRIVETIATGMVDVDAVYNFYAKSLPQLGWRKINARTYERERDRLSITVRSTNGKGQTEVHYKIRPIDEAQ